MRSFSDRDACALISRVLLQSLNEGRLREFIVRHIQHEPLLIVNAHYYKFLAWCHLLYNGMRLIEDVFLIEPMVVLTMILCGPEFR